MEQIIFCRQRFLYLNNHFCPVKKFPFLFQDDAAGSILLREQIEELLTGLTERERQVLELRFGLKDGKTRTLEEVGKYFDVTRERIRQIEAKALRKLKHPSRSRKLRSFLDS